MAKTEKVKGEKYFRGFGGWLLKWGRWWDWIVGAVWLGLIYIFASFSLLSYQEYEPTAGIYGLVITAVIIAVGIVVRWLIYRFIQKRRMARAA